MIKSGMVVSPAQPKLVIGLYLMLNVPSVVKVWDGFFRESVAPSPQFHRPVITSLVPKSEEASVKGMG